MGKVKVPINKKAADGTEEIEWYQLGDEQNPKGKLGIQLQWHDA